MIHARLSRTPVTNSNRRNIPRCVRTIESKSCRICATMARSRLNGRPMNISSRARAAQRFRDPANQPTRNRRDFGPNQRTFKTAPDAATLRSLRRDEQA